MRILAVTPWVPSSRRPRSLGLLGRLHEEHSLHLVACTWGPADEEDLAALPFPTTAVPMSRPAAVLRALCAVPSRRPLQQAYLDSRRVRQAIRSHQERHDVDVLHLHTLRSAQWRAALTDRRTRLAIDLDEFRSAFYDQLSRATRNPLKRLVARIEAARMVREERSIVAAFDSVLISSPVDLREGSTNVHLVRSPHALKSQVPEVEKSSGPTIVFVGRMSYSANVDAVLWFCREVLPAVVERVPGTHLHIVGDSPTHQVRALAGPSVTVHGRVPSVDEHYLSAWVSIVPVTSATGVQMKLIESLELGVAAVTTPLVAQQAGVRDGAEVAVASDAASWVRAVTRLLERPDERLALGERGRSWASSTYSRSAISRSLDDAIAELGRVVPTGPGTLTATGPDTGQAGRPPRAAS